MEKEVGRTEKYYKNNHTPLSILSFTKDVQEPALILSKLKVKSAILQSLEFELPFGYITVDYNAFNVNLREIKYTLTSSHPITIFLIIVYFSILLDIRFEISLLSSHNVIFEGENSVFRTLKLCIFPVLYIKFYPPKGVCESRTRRGPLTVFPFYYVFQKGYWASSFLVGKSTFLKF